MTRTTPSPTRPHTRARRALVPVLAALVLVVPACGGDDGDDERVDRTTTTTEADATPGTTGADAEDPGSTSTTTAASDGEDGGEGTDGADANGDEWGTLDAPAREGTVENVSDGEPLRLDLRRDGQKAELRTGELTMTCLPLLDGDPTTRTTEVLFTDLDVAADGSVEAVLPDAPYKPALTGFFGEDGTFTGNIFLSDVVDDFACGGEFPLLVPAG